jgi:hypothetical protein
LRYPINLSLHHPRQDALLYGPRVLSPRAIEKLSLPCRMVFTILIAPARYSVREVGSSSLDHRRERRRANTATHW